MIRSQILSRSNVEGKSSSDVSCVVKPDMMAVVCSMIGKIALPILVAVSEAEAARTSHADGNYCEGDLPTYSDGQQDTAKSNCHLRTISVHFSAFLMKALQQVLASQQALSSIRVFRQKSNELDERTSLL